MKNLPHTAILTCVYDNPKTMRRECWQDGKLTHSYSYLLFLLNKEQLSGFRIFFGANVGKFVEGRLLGDAKAMEPQQ